MFLIETLSRLSLSSLYKLSDVLFFFSYYILGYRKKIVRKNLRNSFPSKNSEELKLIERNFYRNLCDYAVETLKLASISKQELSDRMVFRDRHVVDKFKQQNQSILFLASHQFNWEWLMVSASANFGMQIDFVYQPVNNKAIDDFTLKLRSRFGAYPIRRKEVARELVKRKDILRGIASVADQYPGYGHDKKYITKFLNQETAFFLGTNQLAHLTQFPAVYHHVRKIRRGYYEATPVIISIPPYPKESDQVIAEYVRAVENNINSAPDGWLWSHNRWKKRHLKK